MMKKYAWCTDIHLDSIPNDTKSLITFGESLVTQNPDGIILTGDISVSSALVYHLSALEKIVQRPVYFVLGNHDYYGSSIENVRKNMRELSNVSSYLKYMPTLQYQTLTKDTALIGHDGWYDALNGNWKTSNFFMSDWKLIEDFRTAVNHVPTIVGLARRLAHEGVMHVHDAIKAAIRYHNNIIIMTHFPPFKEAHMHNGRLSDENAFPWYTSKYMGDMLLDAAKSFPNVNFTVLCGHTHGQFGASFSVNLHVHVGGADYGFPKLQRIIEVP